MMLLCPIKNILSRSAHNKVKITFESPSVQLSHADIRAGELINFFHVERPGINLNTNEQAIAFRINGLVKMECLNVL